MAQQMDPVDIIWYDITKGFQRIIWAQRIFFVKDKDDMTKELKRERPGEYGDEYEWEIQFAGDKYANYIKSEAMQAKVDKTRLEIEKLKNGDGDTEDDLIEDWVKAVESDE
ncbi:hypothetical protein G195_005420 [Phytophthora kernoviae 00238/432]|uniref:Uncharacterized protein n=1 Tax=Phytophthora kernoviae 00238/432 TaxID=1284355 RepID=A0A8J4WC80_9STRA|nr:hypothetical protein G195_005420 [Phytophthora kernoviae 00238/432]